MPVAPYLPLEIHRKLQVAFRHARGVCGVIEDLSLLLDDRIITALLARVQGKNAASVSDWRIAIDALDGYAINDEGREAVNACYAMLDLADDGVALAVRAAAAGIPVVAARLLARSNVRDWGGVWRGVTTYAQEFASFLRLADPCTTEPWLVVVDPRVQAWLKAVARVIPLARIRRDDDGDLQLRRALRVGRLSRKLGVRIMRIAMAATTEPRLLMPVHVYWSIAQGARARVDAARRAMAEETRFADSAVAVLADPSVGPRLLAMARAAARKERRENLTPTMTPTMG